MQLITSAQRQKLLENGRAQRAALDQKQRAIDFEPVVKLFTPVEHAMHEKFSARIETALSRLAARIERSRTRLDPSVINRQIGRILQANQRAAARFDVRLIDSASPAGFHLHVEHNAAFDDWAALSEGAYLLRSNITDWSDE